MDFSVTDDQQSISELAQQIFRDQVPDDYHPRFAASGEALDWSLWKVLADAGLLGVCLEERWGGSGLGMEELRTVLEAQGAVLAPVPLLTSQISGMALQRFAGEACCERWLPGAVAGDHYFSAALSAAERGDLEVLPQAQANGQDWVVQGECHDVPYGAKAGLVLVPARNDAGDLLFFAVPGAADGVKWVTQPGTNLEPRDSLQLSGVALSAADCLARGDAAEQMLEWLLQHFYCGLAALQLGVVQEALQRTATYTGERQQFGRALASFQAVSHRAADGYIDREALRTCIWQAAWRLGQGLDATTEVRAAKWWACEAGHRIGHTAQHLHGGIGADLEYPIHRYFLWAKQIEFSLGGAADLLAQQGAVFAAHDDKGVVL